MIRKTHNKTSDIQVFQTEKERLLHRLFLKTNNGMKFGLERIANAAHALGNPQEKFKAIHVAGTNGKGSICAYLASILFTKGYSVGLYTSPHIVEFEERFLINNKKIATQEWISVYAEIETVCETYELTFFEITTLIAFELFARRNCEWAIIETGLGGRLDATNIISPQATVIATISYDHMDLLGSDLVSIASEKLGIVKKNIPLIMIRNSNKDVMDIAEKICTEHGAPLYSIESSDAKDITMSYSDNTVSFLYNNYRFKLPIFAHYQIVNALAALKTVSCIDSTFENGSFQKAFNTVLLPGRFQVCLFNHKQIILDVGHNPEAIDHFCKTLRQFSPLSACCIIVGIMADKDCKTIMHIIQEIADKIIITKPQTTRAAKPEKLFKYISKSLSGKAEIIDSIEDAVHAAVQSWDGIIGITGSFYTVSEAMRTLKLQPYLIS